MKKVAGWLSTNTITPDAAIYEFEETIIPQIQNTKKLFEKRKIEDPVMMQDIEKFYAEVERLANGVILHWNKKLNLEHSFS